MTASKKHVLGVSPNQKKALNASVNPSATNPYLTASEAAASASSLILYPTTVASGVATYNKAVKSINDPDYDDPAVDQTTGAIAGAGQLVGAFTSAPGVISGNPGTVNVAMIGNIRRTSGSGTATFYFEVYHRDNLGVETLLGTSNATAPADNGVYEQYFASSIATAQNFISTDRVVFKWYANRIAGGSDPVYDIQLGGATPVKATFPVPLEVVSTEHNDLDNIQGGNPTERNHLTNAELTNVQAIDQVFTSAEKTKVGHITVTQAVDLDTMESDTATNNAKVSASGSVTTHSDVDATTKAVFKNNLNAAVDPVATDDSGSGYAVGSEWFNTTADKHWICLDSTAAAAVWKETTAAGGGGGGDLWSMQTYAYNMIGASATWNGTTIGAAGASALNEFRFLSFAGSGQADGAYFNVILPDDYTAGTDLKVSLKASANSAGGDTRYYVGLRKETGSNQFPTDDTTTQYVGATVTNAVNWPVQTLDYVFSGTGLNPGDVVSILIYRDPGDAADTDTATSYVNQAIIREN